MLVWVKSPTAIEVEGGKSELIWIWTFEIDTWKWLTVLKIITGIRQLFSVLINLKVKINL